MWDNLEGFSSSFSLFYTADTWKRCEDLCFYIEKKKRRMKVQILSKMYKQGSTGSYFSI